MKKLSLAIDSPAESQGRRQGPGGGPDFYTENDDEADLIDEADF